MSAPAPFASYFAAPAASAGDEIESAMAGYARGLDEGRRGVEAQAARLVAAGVERIEEMLTALGAELPARFRRLEAGAAQLALAFARQYAAGALAEEERILRAFHAVSADILAAPAVTLALHPGLAEAIAPRLSRWLADRAPDARLIVVPDPALAPGDCRIDWAAGGVALDRARLDRTLSETIARAFPDFDGSDR